MTILPFRAKPPARFRVLVNGFVEDVAYPTLREALTSVPNSGVERSSFEIYDAATRGYVWTRHRRKSRGEWPAPFAIRVNGRANGQTFSSLGEAIQAISLRPRGDNCEVFEAGTCIYARSG